MAIGDSQKLKSGPNAGLTIYDHGGGVWKTYAPDPEAVMQSKVSRGTSLGSTAAVGSKETKEDVAKYKEESWQDFKRDLAVDALGSAPGALLRNAGKAGKLAAQVMGLGTGALASDQIAQMQGREDVNPLRESFLARAMDIGTGAAITGTSRMLNRGVEASRTGDWGSLIPELIRNPGDAYRRIGTKKLAEKMQQNPFEREQGDAAVDAAERWGAPASPLLLTSNPPTNFMSTNAKNKYLGMVQSAHNMIKQLAMPDASVRNATNVAEVAQQYQADYRARKHIFKTQERTAHDNFDDVHIPNNTVTVPVQTGMTPSTTTDYAGNVIQTQPQPIYTNVTIRGPIDVSRSAREFRELDGTLEQIQGSVDLSEDSTRTINQIRSVFSTFQNAPVVNGHQFADYETVKALRSAVSHLTSEFPATNTNKRQLTGTAKKVVAALSRDTRTSITGGIDPVTGAPIAPLWDPAAGAAYTEANALTQRNNHLFNPKRLRKMEGIPDRGDASFGKDLDVDEEAEMMNAMKSLNGVTTLIRGMGEAYADKVSSLFVKIGFDRALDNKTGIYDTNKLDDYFIKNQKNKSILESDVLTRDQRRTVKDFINYTKHLTSLTGTEGHGVIQRGSKMAGGALTFGAGALGAMSGGSLPITSIVGGSIAVGIPITRRFVEDVLLNPAGARIVQQLVYPANTQARMRAQQKLVEFTINMGVKTFARWIDDEGKEQVKDIQKKD